MADCGITNSYESTYRHHYKPIREPKAIEHAQPIKQTDETLISGYYANNLSVNGVQRKTQVWPKSMIGVEEYKDYLKRLECCKSEIYTLYFRGSPCVNTVVIEEMLKDLEKSQYQYIYSPNVFVPRKEDRRFGKSAHEPTNMRYYLTTYGTYFSRIQELIRFKDVLYGLVRNDEKDQLKNELKSIYRTGMTTYITDICKPASETAKRKNLQNGPIDRYTLRRI